MKRIGFFLRAAAFLIDVIVVYIAFVSASVLLNVPQRAGEILFFSFWLAYTSMEVFAAATLGKMILGVAIADASGTPADRWALFLRWSTKQLPSMSQLLFVLTSFPLFYLLGGFSSLIVSIGCLYALNDPKQAWHDQWAKTAVFPRKLLNSVKEPSGFAVLPAGEVKPRIDTGSNPTE